MPISNNPGTLEQWNTFISEYESNLSIQKTALDAKLNDSTLSDANKKAALEDYSRQESYLQWLKTKRDEYEATGEIPSDMSFNITANGDLYRYNGQIHVATLPSLTSYTGDTQDTLYTIDIGTTLTTKSNVICSSPDCNITLTWGGQHTFAQYTHESLKLVATYAPNARTIILGVTVNYSEDPFDKTAYMAVSGSGTWVNASGYTPHEPVTEYGWNESGIVKFGIGYDYKIANTLNDIPTWSNSFYAMFSGPNIWQSFSSANELFARRYCSVSYSGDLSNTTPWDFYNDDILPEVDSNNAVFPDGYNPVSPDDPPDEQTNLPHDDGTPSEQQTDRSVGVPSQFITQYLLTYEELATVGANLWQSWLTPNTDVWMNFFFSYRQDFGTLNIGACLDFIISLRVYPFDFVNYLDLFVQAPGLYMGTGHTDFLGSTCPITRKLFHAFDCGTCEVKPATPYSDFRDMYNTSVLLFLPYCGTVELNPAEVMYRTIRAYYYVDFQSGGCTAVVELQGDAGWYMIASKTGQIGFLLPMTATNAGQLSAQFGKDATETVGTLSGLFFDVANSIAQSAENVARVLAFNKAQKDVSNKKDVPFGTTVTQSLEIGQSGVNTALSLANQKLDRLSRSGVQMPMLSGGAGAESLMFPDTPFVQIRRGKYAKPDNYPHSQGFLNGSSNLISYYKGAFKGSPTIDPSYKGRGLCKFTGVDSTGLTCNNDERVEIINLLESGVYL